jgi:thiol-disulfide isomerase/thioredoxin
MPRLIPLIKILILLLGGAWIWVSRTAPGSTTNGQIPAPQEGFLAPDFSLPVLGSNQTVSLAEQRGKVVLVNLWASWCPPCKAEMPAMQRAYEDYGQQGFVILAINATGQDNQANAQAFVQQQGLTFPILLDVDGTAAASYQLHSYPTSFFVGKDGIIRAVVIGGPMSEALLRSRIESLLSEAP